jgi:hypothetical protein
VAITKVQHNAAWCVAGGAGRRNQCCESTVMVSVAMSEDDGPRLCPANGQQELLNVIAGVNDQRLASMS